MNSTNDRMGGFISAKIIDVKDIESFQVQNNKVRLVYKDNYIPTSLDIAKNGVEAAAPCITSKSGNLYHIDITIEVKTLNFIAKRSFNKFLSLLELPTGEIHVFGTPDFPLSLSSERIYSKTPSGRTGGFIKMTGKQPNNVLIL